MKKATKKGVINFAVEGLDCEIFQYVTKFVMIWASTHLPEVINSAWNRILISCSSAWKKKKRFILAQKRTSKLCEIFRWYSSHCCWLEYVKQKLAVNFSQMQFALVSALHAVIVDSQKLPCSTDWNGVSSYWDLFINPQWSALVPQQTVINIRDWAHARLTAHSATPAYQYVSPRVCQAWN